MSFYQKYSSSENKVEEPKRQSETASVQQETLLNSQRSQISESIQTKALNIANSVEVSPEISSLAPLSIEQLQNTPNGLSEEKLDALMDLIEQWTKGTRRNLIYYYLLQHGYELEEGVDYSQNPSSSLPTLEEAKEQAREQWASQPEVQKWRSNSEKLLRQISAVYQKNPEIKVARSKPNHFRYLTNETSDTSVNSMLFDKGWLYVEGIPSSKQDVIENRQQPSEAIKYKVYLSCPYTAIHSVIRELAIRLGKDPILQQTGFHFKTRDGSSSRHDLTSLAEDMNRLDSIVLYLGENGTNAALPILQQLAEEKPQLFKQEGVLFAQPIITKAGAEIPGVRIAQEIGQAQRQSYNQIQAGIITQSIDLDREAVREVFRNPERKAEFRESFRQNYLRLAEEAGLSTHNLAFAKNS